MCVCVCVCVRARARVYHYTCFGLFSKIVHNDKQQMKQKQQVKNTTFNIVIFSKL